MTAPADEGSGGRMSVREQLTALERASSLIFRVEQARRAGDACDKQIAHVCYLARVEIGKVDSECRIELGYRERKWFNSIVPGRTPPPQSGESP